MEQVVEPVRNLGPSMIIILALDRWTHRRTESVLPQLHVELPIFPQQTSRQGP